MEITAVEQNTEKRKKWNDDSLRDLSTTLKVKVKSLSRVGLFATPWTVVYQVFPSMGFRVEYWSGLLSTKVKESEKAGLKLNI